jgi:hypothetical protein
MLMKGRRADTGAPSRRFAAARQPSRGPVCWEQATWLFSIYPPCRDISSRSQCCTPGRRERGSADKEAALEEAVGYAGAQVPAGQERNLEVADGTGNRHSRSVHAEKNNRERPIAESPMTAFFRTNRQTWFNTKCTSDEVRLCGAQRCRSRSPRSVSTRPMASDEALELVSRGRPKRFVHLEANANTECFEWCPTVLVRVLRLLHPLRHLGRRAVLGCAGASCDAAAWKEAYDSAGY